MTVLGCCLVTVMYFILTASPQQEQIQVFINLCILNLFIFSKRKINVFDHVRFASLKKSYVIQFVMKADLIGCIS